MRIDIADRAVVAGEVERGISSCGSGVSVSVCANKVPGVREALIHDHFSARQDVEDDHTNMLCIGGRTLGPALAWDLVQTFPAAEFSQAERQLRRLGKVSSLEGTPKWLTIAVLDRCRCESGRAAPIR